MASIESIDQQKVREYHQAIADLNEHNANARRLEEMYVRYVILANAAGIAACLSIAGVILKDRAAAIPLSHIVVPLWLYAIGVISGGFFVTLRRAQAIREADVVARRIRELRKSVGDIFVDPKPTYSAFVERSLPHLGTTSQGAFAVSQLAFLAGTFWGLVEISLGG